MVVVGAIAYRLLVDTGVVPQAGQNPWSMGPASSEPTELTAEQKYVAEFVETVMERAKDYGIQVDSIWSGFTLSIAAGGWR
ncbi:MAG: hypothetical protein WB869_03945 [Candidatus Acidiferrales bacterium]